MFPESQCFWEIQNSTITEVTFASKCSRCANIHLFRRLDWCWKHSWKPFCQSLFSSSVAFLRMRRKSCHSITEAPSLHCSFQSREQVKISCSQVEESMGDAPVLHHCSLLRNPWPKPTSVLEHYREGETNSWFSIFEGVSFSPHPSDDSGCQCTILYSQFCKNFLHAVIPVNQTTEFREILEATMYGGVEVNIHAHRPNSS
jgi:hypothetical protein